ncbi:hypothetical protein [Hamadaea tsunoensis]|uniref:hypothetical protein n=1 Tax=Hamadaea tsunoensis TaxID=53368 RepID=UPI000403E290|nr:hypothetical protein [Hamadaea tsunoensis]
MRADKTAAWQCYLIINEAILPAIHRNGGQGINGDLARLRVELACHNRHWTDGRHLLSSAAQAEARWNTGAAEESTVTLTRLARQLFQLSQ